MQSTSGEFRDAVRGPHHSTAKVEIVRDRVVTRALDAHGGQVTADRSGAHLRRFSAIVADPTGELTPQDIRDELAPFGPQARVYRGVRIQRVSTAVAFDSDVASWESGTHDGTAVDPATGELALAADIEES